MGNRLCLENKRRGFKSKIYHFPVECLWVLSLSCLKVFSRLLGLIPAGLLCESSKEMDMKIHDKLQSSPGMSWFSLSVDWELLETKTQFPSWNLHSDTIPGTEWVLPLWGCELHCLHSPLGMSQTPTVQENQTFPSHWPGSAGNYFFPSRMEPWFEAKPFTEWLGLAYRIVGKEWNVVSPWDVRPSSLQVKPRCSHMHTETLRMDIKALI